MPYDIRSTDDCEHEVYNKETGKVMGCAGSREKAEKMIAAMYANADEGDAEGDGKAEDVATIEFKSVPFEVKAAGEDSKYPHGYMEGYAAVFNNLDSGGDIIVPGAFSAGLDRFTKDGFIGSINHGWDNPIGHPVEARETPEGLYIKAVFDSSPDAQAVRAKMTPHPETGRATIRKFSIGYRATDAAHAGADEVKSYWKSVGYKASDAELAHLASRKKARMLRKTDLFEASPVSVAMNDRAIVAAVKCGMGYMGMGGGMSYGPGPGGGSPTLDDATDRIRDSVVGIFLDYLMMSVRVVVANDMVAPADRLTILSQTFDQTRDAFLQYLKPILLADDSDDAVEDISNTIESLGKQFHAGLEAAGMDIDRKAIFAVPASGSDFTSHSRLVVSASDECSASIAAYVKRAEDKDEARFKVGRTFSQAHVDEIDSVADSIESSARTHLGHAARLRVLTAKAKDKRTPAGTFPAIPAAAGTQPLLLGGKAASVDAPAVEAKAIPAGPDLSAYFVQFHATDPALLGIDVAK